MSNRLPASLSPRRSILSVRLGRLSVFLFWVVSLAVIVGGIVWLPTGIAHLHTARECLRIATDAGWCPNR